MGLRNESFSVELLSKMATNNGHGENSAYFDGWKAYDRDPFHPSSNPNGILQMGLAENQLCLDLIEDWILKNPQASICTAQGVSDFDYIANFQDYNGLRQFREAVANFMGKARGDRVKFDPDRIVMSGGSTGANETLMFCLADPGDAFLIPTPYYPAFDRDMGWRTGVKLIPVHCDSSNGFMVTRDAVEDAYARAIESNTKVKGLVLCNPSNPLGTILNKATLVSLVDFVNDKQIHLIADEIYAATTFKSPEYVSVSEVVAEMDSRSCNRDLIHVVYSLSKDLGVPGFRVGIVYSYNDRVVSCARKMSSFGLVSSQTQRLVASMLSDNAFVETFLRESKRRLKRRQEHFTEGVARVGIRCLRSNAGLFVWMDLRHLLKETTLEGEVALWRLIIHDMKINVSPGSSFHCSEPGWFRVCFANMDDDTLEVALGRIRSFMLKGKNKGVAKDDDKIIRSKKRNWKRSDLRLSFSGGARRFDDNIVASSPHLMSPHSPLVKART
ncbi:hypothetical protein V2J09_024276 [Rumex salicifolius]